MPESMELKKLSRNCKLKWEASEVCGVMMASTGKLTVTGADSKEYTIPMPEELPSYTLDVTKDGKITLKKDGKEVSSGTIDIPEIPEIRRIRNLIHCY